MIRLNEAQYRKVKKLTRRLCANNDGGCCLLLDDGDPCVCVQAISFSLLCRYFREAVLPADRGLCADIMRQHDTRKNVSCAESRSTPAAIAPNTATPAQYLQHGGWLVNASAVNAKETQNKAASHGLGAEKPCSKPLSSRTFGMRGINLPNSRKTALKA